jgi:MFS family permease
MVANRLLPTAAASLRKHWPIAALLLVQCLNGIVVSAQRYFFPIYVSDALGATAVLASSLVSMAQAAGMVAALMAGGLTDTLGRKWTLVLGLGCFVVSSIAFFARAPWLVAALWVANGLAMSLESLGAQSYLIGAAEHLRIGTISAFYHWGFTLGGALGSPFAGYVLDTHGYAGFARLLMGLATFNTLLAIAVIPRLQQREARQDRRRWAEVLAGYLDVVRQPTVIRLGLIRFLPTCYYGMSGVLIPLLIYAQTGTKLSVAAFVTTSQILAMLAQLITGRAADRFGPRVPTLVAMGGVAAAALGQAIFAEQPWGLFAFGCLGMASAWSLSTLMLVLVSRAVASHEQGRVLGALHLGWNLAMVLSVLVGGVLVEVRAGLPFAVASALGVGGVVAVVSYFGRQGGAVAAEAA